MPTDREILALVEESAQEMDQPRIAVAKVKCVYSDIPNRVTHFFVDSQDLEGFEHDPMEQLVVTTTFDISVMEERAFENWMERNRLRKELNDCRDVLAKLFGFDREVTPPKGGRS